MAYEALKHYSERTMTFRFVSNVDGTDFAEATALCVCLARTPDPTFFYDVRSWSIRTYHPDESVAIDPEPTGVAQFCCDALHRFFQRRGRV
jgi:hypothetical protein